MFSLFICLTGGRSLLCPDTSDVGFLIFKHIFDLHVSVILITRWKFTVSLFRHWFIYEYVSHVYNETTDIQMPDKYIPDQW